MAVSSSSKVDPFPGGLPLIAVRAERLQVVQSVGSLLTLRLNLKDLQRLLLMAEETTPPGRLEHLVRDAEFNSWRHPRPRVTFIKELSEPL